MVAPLSAQAVSRATMLATFRKVLATDPGYYVLQCAPWQTPSAQFHVPGSFHIWPSPSQGTAGDLNHRPDSGRDEHYALQKAAIVCLEAGLSITFPLTWEDNEHGTVANHCGANLHLHVDCGSYSNVGKGAQRTADVKDELLTYLRKATASQVLAHGSTGADVRELQRAAGVTSDGIFGDKTEAAVKALQRQLKRADLYAGKIDGVWGVQSQTAYATFCDGVLGPRTIRAWQRNARTPVDGVISKPSKLIAKVQRVDSRSGAVQKRYKLTGHEIDGVLGPNTWRMLQDLMGFTGHDIDGVPGTKTITHLQQRILRGRY